MEEYKSVGMGSDYMAEMEVYALFGGKYRVFSLDKDSALFKLRTVDRHLLSPPRSNCEAVVDRSGKVVVPKGWDMKDGFPDVYDNISYDRGSGTYRCRCAGEWEAHLLSSEGDFLSGFAVCADRELFGDSDYRVISVDSDGDILGAKEGGFPDITDAVSAMKADFSSAADSITGRGKDPSEGYVPYADLVEVSVEREARKEYDIFCTNMERLAGRRSGPVDFFSYSVTDGPKSHFYKEGVKDVLVRKTPSGLDVSATYYREKRMVSGGVTKNEEKASYSDLRRFARDLEERYRGTEVLRKVTEAVKKGRKLDRGM